MAYPYYKRVKWFWRFTKLIPDGWTDYGETGLLSQGILMEKFLGCKFDQTRLHLGQEGEQKFYWCPMCKSRQKV